MLNQEKMNQINSAEMTAYWRSKEHLLSGDSLSLHLASATGVSKAQAFMQNLNYVLVSRLISVRAGYFLKQAAQLLSFGLFDYCISFASGFSLLTYYLASHCANNQIANIQFCDSDLEHVATLRKSRVQSLINNNILDNMLATTISLKVFNLEELVGNKVSLNDLLPQSARPLIILEGISYFISAQALKILFAELFTYTKCGIILDCFPANAAQISTLFANKFNQVSDYVPNIVNNLMLTDFKDSCNQCSLIEYISIQIAEQQLCQGLNIKPLLLDPNTFFPTQVLTLCNC